MTTLNVNTITPSGSTLTLGASGDTIVATDDVKVNTVKDAGGNTLWVSDGSGNLSSVKVSIGGADRLLSTQTVSSSVTGVEFTTGFSTDYKEYVFKCSGMNTTVEDFFNFQCSTDGGSSYGVTNTSTFFWAYHTEAGSSSLTYRTDADRSNSTDFIPIFGNTTAGAPYSASGEVHLFNPASTTYVKNHYSRGSSKGNTSWAMDTYVAGYFNTTSAINAIKFTFSSGNIQAGKIKMYGIVS